MLSSEIGVPFDLKRLEVKGGPVPVVEGVTRSLLSQTGVAHFGVSDKGSLIYWPGPVSASGAGGFALGFADRKGAVEPLKLPAGSYEIPVISPDGKRLAFDTNDGKGTSVWIYEFSGERAMRRLTFGGANPWPMWSGDGERVVFQSNREGDSGLFWQRADGTGTAERLTKPDPGITHGPGSWPPNSQHFSFHVSKGDDTDVWMFSAQDKKATPFVEAPKTFQGNSAVSPDGRWVAYESRETGTGEIFVQPYPASGAKFQIS